MDSAADLPAAGLPITEVPVVAPDITAATILQQTIRVLAQQVREIGVELLRPILAGVAQAEVVQAARPAQTPACRRDMVVLASNVTLAGQLLIMEEEEEEEFVITTLQAQVA